MKEHAMAAPITIWQWTRSKSARPYVVISALYTSFLSLLSVLKLFGWNIQLPNLPATNKGWLTLNFLLQFLFTGYVAFTAIKFSQLDNPDKADPSESDYWQTLELQDPSSTKRKEKVDSEDWVHYKRSVNKVAKQFAWFWFLGWLTWCCHYAFLLVVSLKPAHASPAWSNLFNNLNSLMFVFLFMTLTVSTAKYGAIFWFKLSFIVVGLFLIERLFFDQVGVLWFTVLSGLFASTALAAFIGSIDSKFINIPIKLVATLYLYAALQSLYILIELTEKVGAFYKTLLEQTVELSKRPETWKLQPENWKLISELLMTEQSIRSLLNFLEISTILMIALAFFLKAALFITVTWMLRTGRLVYFIIEEGSLNFKRDRNFVEFSERIKVSESTLT